jgi:hypothetical protein
MTLVKHAMQMTPIQAYGLNILAVAYHIAESSLMNELRVGDHTFFITFWSIYSWMCIMSVATFYPGAQQYVSDYFAFIKGQVDEVRAEDEEMMNDPTIPVNDKHSNTTHETKEEEEVEDEEFSDW